MYSSYTVEKHSQKLSAPKPVKTQSKKIILEKWTNETETKACSFLAKVKKNVYQ